MKQKSMGLGSTLTRKESKLVGGNYKMTHCTTNDDCKTACSYVSSSCPPNFQTARNCYFCVANVCKYVNADGTQYVC